MNWKSNVRNKCKRKYDLFVLVVTDIINSDSKILVVGAEKDKVGQAFNVQLDDGMAFLSGVVSRKNKLYLKSLKF